MICLVCLFCAATAIASPAQSFATFYSFCSQSNCTDGSGPAARSQATDGNFYGTTYAGGTATVCGTVFRITPGGTLTTLHSFDGYDGSNPTAALVQATDGNFYGTTYGGGADAARLWHGFQDHPRAAH